jgi:hypothetical protein
MNDESLNEKLRSLELPAPDPAAREKALHRALIAFENREASAPPTPRTYRAGWLVVGAAAALVCALGILLPHVLTERPADLASQRALLKQMEALFPGQLRAIVEHGDDVDVLTEDERGSASDQPLVVTFRSAAKTIRVVSYSGRDVCLTIAGENVCFEMLLTDDGDVILSGKDFLWSRANRVQVAGCQVEASPLNRS